MLAGHVHHRTLIKFLLLELLTLYLLRNITVYKSHNRVYVSAIPPSGFMPHDSKNGGKENSVTLSVRPHLALAICVNVVQAWVSVSFGHISSQDNGLNIGWVYE